MFNPITNPPVIILYGNTLPYNKARGTNDKNVDEIFDQISIDIAADICRFRNTFRPLSVEFYA